MTADQQRPCVNPKPMKPEGLEAPGLAWKARKTGWVAYWVARQDIVERGFKLPTQQLATSHAPIDWDTIAKRCRGLQSEMHSWDRSSNKKPRPVKTVEDAVRLYATDPDSDFRALRHHTRGSYQSKMNTLITLVGQQSLKALGFRDFKRWYRTWRDGPEGNEDRVARAHGLMTMLRIVIAFGAALEVEHCDKLCLLLSGRKRGGLGVLNFEMPKKRTAFLSAAQAVSIRAEANRRGHHSIALAQAIQYETMMRQKDVIGEWVPVSEPGSAETNDTNNKWINGLHWSQVDNNLVLTKTLSKSLKGRKATVGTALSFNLNSYPMIVEELDALRAASMRVANLRDTAQHIGPIIICEYTGLPWRTKEFQRHWRLIARAAGIPDHVQNRDSRAGGITEATDAAGQDFELVRRHAGHSQPSMTARYSRNHVEANDELARRRVQKRRGPWFAHDA